MAACWTDTFHACCLVWHESGTFKTSCFWWAVPKMNSRPVIFLPGAWRGPVTLSSCPPVCWFVQCAPMPQSHTNTHSHAITCIPFTSAHFKFNGYHWSMRLFSLVLLTSKCLFNIFVVFPFLCTMCKLWSECGHKSESVGNECDVDVWKKKHCLFSPFFSRSVPIWGDCL